MSLKDLILNVRSKWEVLSVVRKVLILSLVLFVYWDTYWVLKILFPEAMREPYGVLLMVYGVVGIMIFLAMLYIGLRTLISLRGRNN